VLNGVLLAFVVGLLPLMLYVSVLLLGAAGWFIKKLLTRGNELERDIIELVSKVEGFSEHLENLHSLETYYGDEDLQNLLNHSKQLINDFIDFQELYFDVEVEVEPAEEEEAPQAQE
jgi:hypothetical protein